MLYCVGTKGFVQEQFLGTGAGKYVNDFGKLAIYGNNGFFVGLRFFSLFR